ncbi:dATP/dGTP pyrophosphohydrolase domain-containing protein [Klebsiella pneumoniae]|nr:dATP/dGTP pyrophosphohydrolase domain-containing protein [Klebsiella pneumoniae]
MTSKLTREQLIKKAQEQIAFCRHTKITGEGLAHVNQCAALFEIALAAMDSEPVAWTWHYREQWHVTNDKCRAEFVAKDGDVAVLPLYRHAQTAPERDQVRSEHAEWSQATFGNVGPVGPLKHLSKEALEAAEQPGDLSEWADMQFLLWDAQRRAGITDDQITQAMIEKLAVNKQREWPEPKDGEPRLHIKEQPAPVVQCVPLGDSPYDVPYSMPSNLRELIAEEIGILFSDDDAQSVWNVCRSAAMLAADPQSPGSEPAAVPGKWIPVSERMPETDGNYWGWWSESKRQGPVWFIKSELQAQFQSHEITHWMPLPAAPQEVKGE